MTKKDSLDPLWCSFRCEHSPTAAISGCGIVDCLRIEAGLIAKRLIEFSWQTGLQVLFGGEQIGDQSTSRVSGDFRPGTALGRLLATAHLAFRFVNWRTIAFRGVTNALPLATAQISERTRCTSSPAARLDSGGADYTVIQSCAPPRQDRAIPEILIKGYGSLNADIGRTEDDIQPYIIFDQQKIARSGAANGGDFFKTERTTITGAATSDQPGETLTTDVSAINLRGLEATQTFILVDGRRPPGGPIDGDAPQPDIIGIPLSSIESIEVLPTTASAIYGSGTRRDAVSGVPT